MCDWTCRHPVACPRINPCAIAPATWQCSPRSAAPHRAYTSAYFCFFLGAGTVGVGRTSAQGSIAFCSGVLLVAAL
jgi:hypothetical protein